jgi:hypothetical protein
MHESGGLSFSGKAMLHILRARLAPQLPAVSDGVKRVDSKSLIGFSNMERPESGVLSKVFKLWNKDGSAGPSRTKKKLATVKCGGESGGCFGLSLTAAMQAIASGFGESAADVSEEAVSRCAPNAEYGAMTAWQAKPFRHMHLR